MPESLVWRRLLAFIVDSLVAGCAAVLIVTPFIVGNTDNVRLASGSGYFVPTIQSCEERSTAPEPILELARQHLSAEAPVTGIVVCDYWLLGLYDGRTVEVRSTVSTSPGLTRTSSVTIPVDKANRHVDPIVVNIDVIALMVLIFGGAAILSATGGRTPGKWLLGLRVHAASTGFGRMVARETLRLLPILVVVLGMLIPAAAFALGLVDPQVLWVVGQGPSALFWVLNFLPPILGIILTLLWWVVPMAAFHGRMPYDRLVGARVERPAS